MIAARRRFLRTGLRAGLLSLTALPLPPLSLLAAAGEGTMPGQDHALNSWREALLIVADPEPWIDTLSTIGGWEVVYRGVADSTLNGLWNLGPSARSEQVLMRNVGTQSGYLRLIRVSGAEQRIIRPDDQAWETGGVQALDMRVLDIESTRTALHARGWRAPSDPVRYHAYGVEVIQWAPSSPDGIRLSFIQRIAPPLQGWDELKRWSRAANAAITVKDMAAAQAFFAGTVGLIEASHTDTVGGDGPNVMGLPWSMARRLPIDIRGYRGAGKDDGGIELIAMVEAQGRDFAAYAHPPNLGIAGLRIVTDDVAAIADRLTKRGLRLAAPVQPVTVPPYGVAQVCAVSGADGVWLEFLQLPS